MSVIAFRTKTVVRWTCCWAAGGCLGRWWGQEGRVAWARCGGLLSGKDAGASQTAGRFSSHPVCSEVKSHIDMTLTFLVCYSGWCWAKSSGGDSLGDLPGLTQPCPGTCLSGAGTGWGCGSSQHRLWGQESHFRNSSAHFSLFHWLLQGQQEAQLPTFLRLKHAFLLLLPFRWQKELVPGPLSTGEWHPISPTLLKNLEGRQLWLCWSTQFYWMKTAIIIVLMQCRTRLSAVAVITVLPTLKKIIGSCQSSIWPPSKEIK